MPTFFKNGIIQKDGKNLGVPVKSATGSPGQNPASGNFANVAGGIPTNVKDIGQKVFSGAGAVAEKFTSNLRGANLPFKGGPGDLSFQKASFASQNVEEKDWRVSLSLPSHEPAFKNSELLAPFKSTGDKFVFPYTPTIIIQHSANYSNVAPIHNNYPFFTYQNSQVNELVIVGQFYAQNALEAQYWVAALHYLRSVTKMDFGQNGTGNPPPIVKLNGYGDYVFNDLSCIITTFTVDMPNEVDYIATGLKAQGGDPASAEYISWAPSESQFSISVQPIFSRDKVRQFNYKQFVAGNLIDKGYV